jgi:hypothetical protein
MTSSKITKSEYPDELVHSIRRRNVIVITGTGFSCLASGNPLIDGQHVATWPGLLEHGLQYCVANGLHGASSTRDVRVQLDEKETRQLIGAAQTILGWLGKGPGSHRQKWLNESVGRLELTDGRLVRALQLLSPNVLLTLNYDDLLEQGTQYPSLDSKDHNAIAAVLRKDADAHVIHLHGHWKEGDNVVADFFAYRDLIKNEASRHLMQELFIYRRLLFVGCRGTFEDPHFEGAMNDLLKAGVAYTHTHYVLCLEKDVDDMQRVLRKSNLFRPLPYGDSYDDLVPFLDGLAKDANVELEDVAVSNSAIGMSRQKPVLRYRRASDVWRRQVDD